MFYTKNIFDFLDTPLKDFVENRDNFYSWFKVKSSSKLGDTVGILKRLGPVLIIAFLVYEFILSNYTPRFDQARHDGSDFYAVDLLKKEVPQQEIQRGMCDINISPNGMLFISFRPTHRFDHRFQTGLMLVFKDDTPVYTLECIAERFFSCEFEQDRIYLIRQGDSFTRVYTLNGEYLGKTEKKDSLPRKAEVTASNGTKYKIEVVKMYQQVVKISPDGERKVIYKTSSALAIKQCIYYSIPLIGLLCIGVPSLWEKHQKWRKRIEEEKKNGKSIWA